MATTHTLLYTVASVLSISSPFSALPLLPLASRAARHPLHPLLRLLPLLSLTSLSLFGILSLQCLFSPPSTASHWASGVAGCLAILILDLYLVTLVWSWEKSANGVGWTTVAWTGTLVGVSTAMHIALLTGAEYGFAIPALRAASHLALDLVLFAFFARELARYQLTSEGSSDSESVSNERHQAQFDPHRFSNPWRPTSLVKSATNSPKRQSTLSIVIPSIRSAIGAGHASDLWECQPFRLLMIQPLSIVIFIACICFPVRYSLVDSSDGSLLTPYTLFGTKTSPTGAIVLSALQVARWVSVAMEMALCRRNSAMEDFHLEELQMRQGHGTPALSDCATYDSAMQQHRARLSPSGRGPTSSSPSSISYIHSYSLNKRARFVKTSPLRVATPAFDATVYATSLSPPAPSLLSPRAVTPPFLGEYSLPTELRYRESITKGKQKESSRPARLSGLHLSLDSTFDSRFEITQSYTPIHSPPPAHVQRTTSPSPKPSARNSRRRRGASDASIRSGMEIDIEGGDPFLREPSFEATEEMWRKRSGSKRDSEDASDISLAGSLRGELLQVVAEEVPTTPVEETLRDQTPSPRPPSPPQTPVSMPMKVNIIAPTPTQSPPDKSPADEGPGKISLPSHYEDPFPPPGTDYPTYTLPFDPVSPLSLSFSRFPSSSAPPIGEQSPPDTRPTRPSLPMSWTSNSTASFSTVKSWSVSTSLALKKMRKAKVESHAPGSRDSSHSDESFSCVGDANEDTPPSQHRQRETYSTFSVAGKDDDMERIVMPIEGSRSPSPTGLRTLHLPALLEDGEVTRTNGSAVERRRSWWKVGGRRSPTSRFSEESEMGMSTRSTNELNESGSSSQTDGDGSGSSLRSRTTTPRPPSPPFSLELASSYGSRSAKSSERSAKSTKRPLVEQHGPSHSTPPPPHRISPFAFSSDNRLSAEIRSAALNGEELGSIFTWGSIFNENHDNAGENKLSTPDRRDDTSSSVDEGDSFSSSSLYSPNRATIGSITSGHSQNSRAESERRLLSRTSGLKSRTSEDSLSASGSHLFATPAKFSREIHSSLAMLLERENDPSFNLNAAYGSPTPPSSSSNSSSEQRHHPRARVASDSPGPVSSPSFSEGFSSPSSFTSPISPTFSQALSLPDTPASSVFGGKETSTTPPPPERTLGEERTEK